MHLTANVPMLVIPYTSPSHFFRIPCTAQVPKHKSDELITDLDMHVGATLIVYSRGFLLTDADEPTMRYMELQVCGWCST